MLKNVYYDGKYFPEHTHLKYCEIPQNKTKNIFTEKKNVKNYTQENKTEKKEKVKS